MACRRESSLPQGTEPGEEIGQIRNKSGTLEVLWMPEWGQAKANGFYPCLGPFPSTEIQGKL